MRSSRKQAGRSRPILLLSAVLLLTAGVVFVVARLRGGRLPNVLVISLCSVRADHMSCYGYPRKTTPSLDAFAQHAIVFDRAVTPWPKTAPAFAAIMTGQYGHTTGVMRITPNQYLSDAQETLAETLRTHGYETGAFISTPALNRQTNILQGFDHVEEVWRLPDSFVEATSRAVGWLKQPREKPFFAWVHYNNAHYPYHAEGAPRDLFVGDEFYHAERRVRLNSPAPLALDVPSDHPYREQIVRPDIGGIHPSAVLRERPQEFDFYIARYDAGIYGADRMVGNLLLALQALGHAEDTIVAVIGDHGESLGDHDYFFEHGRFPYEDCAHVPLMIRPAGGTDAMRVALPVATFGLAPTLLEMLGIDPPKAMEAASLLPIVGDGQDGRYVFMESGYQLDYTLSVRHENWKLIHVPNAVDRSLMTGSEYELYDLSTDPQELSNLYDANPDVAGRLGTALREWSQPWVAEAYARGPTPAAPEIDDAARDRLRSLGYLP